MATSDTECPENSQPNMDSDPTIRTEEKASLAIAQPHVDSLREEIKQLKKYQKNMVIVMVLIVGALCLISLYTAKVNFYDDIQSTFKKHDAIQFALALRTSKTDFRLTNYYKLLSLKSQLQAMKLSILYDGLKAAGSNVTTAAGDAAMLQYLNYQLEHSDSQLDLLSSIYQVPRLIFFKNFAQHKAEKMPWASEPFYSKPNGYRMRLVVVPGGQSDNGTDSHISVHIQILEGDFDQSLTWPFRGEITIELLNWRENLEENNYEEMILDFGAIGGSCGQVGKICGWPKFVSHDDLKYNKAKNTEYIRNDMLLFRIVSVTIRE